MTCDQFIKTSFLLLTLFVVGCSTPPKTIEAPLPSWVTAPPKDDQYLYGVGSAEVLPDIASSFDLAIKQANLDIANQLSVTVQSMSAQNTQVQVLDSQQEQVMKTLSQLVRVETNPITLDSTETDRRFSHTRYVYVLQKLDRKNIIKQLKDKISAVDNQILKINEEAQYDRPLIDQWPQLLPALSLLTERRQLNEKLSLYSKGEIVEQPQHVFKVQAKTAQLIRELRISVDEEGLNKDLSQAVSSSLSKKGLTPTIVHYTNSLLSLFLTPQYEYKTQEKRHYVFVSLNARLEQNDQTGLASWTTSARGISSNKEQAKILANQELADHIANSIFVWMTAKH